MIELSTEIAKFAFTGVLLFVAWFGFELLKLKRFHGTLKRLKIPGPEPSISKSGNMVDFYEGYPKKDNITEWLNKYGNMLGFYLDNQMHIVTDDLEILKTVFVDRQDIFDESAAIISDVLLKNRVLLEDRERWKYYKKLIGTMLNMYGSNEPEVIDAIKSAGNELAGCVDAKLQSVNGKLVAKSVNVTELMESCTIVIYSRLAMPEIKCSVGDNKYRKLANIAYVEPDPYYEAACKYPFLAPVINMLKEKFHKSEYYEVLVAFCDEVIEKTVKYIEKRRKLGDAYKGGETDEEKQLDEAYKNDANKTYVRSLTFTLIREYVDGKLTLDEVKASLVIASFQSNFDGISRVLMYTTWVFGQYPEIQEKTRQDIKEFGHSSPYLYQVVQETNRMYPPVSNVIKRRSNRDCSIKGYNFPKSTVFLYHLNTMAKNPKLWSEPEKFDPDRFREGVEIHKCAYQPFGFGVRMCPASKYSYNAVRVVFSEMLLKYKITTTGPQKLELQDVGQTMSEPTDNIFVDFELL